MYECRSEQRSAECARYAKRLSADPSWGCWRGCEFHCFLPRWVFGSGRSVTVFTSRGSVNVLRSLVSVRPETRVPLWHCSATAPFRAQRLWQAIECVTAPNSRGFRRSTYPTYPNIAAGDSTRSGPDCVKSHRRFTASRTIICAWLNDESTLRSIGSQTDPYAVFHRMRERGTPPSDWDALVRAREAMSADE